MVWLSIRLLLFFSVLLNIVLSFAPIVPVLITDLIRMRQEHSMRLPSSMTHDDDKCDSPLSTIGLLADIQYAPVDDGFSYSGNARFYRHALDVAREAAQNFQECAVDLVVNLGDTVDGKCVSEAGQDGAGALDQVLEALSTYHNGPILHVYGNHCLYNANRNELQTKMQIPMATFGNDELVGAYSHLVAGTNLRLVVLDSYDVCLLQRTDATTRANAQAILAQHNGANVKAGNPNSPEGLNGLERRFVAFNGAVGEQQLAWLRSTIEQARSDGERVILFSHQPLHPSTTNPICLMWNYEKVLQVLLEEDAASDVVVASFAGHAHKYGYVKDGDVHFRVLEAVLESPAPYTTYAFLEVYTDRLVLRGKGECQSATYYLSENGPKLKRLESRVTIKTASNL